MFKKKETYEEESSCRTCVYAQKEGQAFYCQKKKRPCEGDDTCAAYEYDLLKRIPKPFPALPTLDGRGGEL